MYGKIAITPRSIDELTQAVGRGPIERLRRLAEPMRGLRVLHLSAPHADGVLRGLLESTVPLLADLGLDVQWQQVRIPQDYAETDAQLCWALSGLASDWGEKHQARWIGLNEANAQLFDDEFDVVVVHHEGSIGLLAAIEAAGRRPKRSRWIWHAYRDYHDALPEVWQFVGKYADAFDATVYSYRDFIRNDAPSPRKVVVRPGVDPLSPRTQLLPRDVRRALLAQRGIDTERPLLAQIFFDLREDAPERMLDVYSLIKQRRPDVQLIVANLVTEEGPELYRYLSTICARSKALGDIVVLTPLDGVGHTELAALREEATVLVHQGARRGLSMELLEEMWQLRPIVSSRSSGASAALVNGRTGLLTETVDDQAAAVLRLLDNPDEAARMGRAAHAAVRRSHMVTHHLTGWLHLLQRLTGYG